MTKYLFWLDLEMTGLDPVKEKILEVALIVTDLNLNPVFEYESVVFQEAHILKSMDAWCQEHHGKSGLSAKVPFGKKEELVDKELADIFLKFQPECGQNQGDTPFSKGHKALLAGNSIHSDRKFIDRYLPQMAALLHYRMLDVSSLKIVFEHMYGKKFQKKNAHRALDDILESIAELKYYRQFISLENDSFQEI